MVVHTFDYSTPEADTGEGTMSMRQPGLQVSQCYIVTPSPIKKKKKKCWLTERGRKLVNVSKTSLTKEFSVSSFQIKSYLKQKKYFLATGISSP